MNYAVVGQLEFGDSNSRYQKSQATMMSGSVYVINDDGQRHTLK